MTAEGTANAMMSAEARLEGQVWTVGEGDAMFTEAADAFIKNMRQATRCLEEETRTKMSAGGTLGCTAPDMVVMATEVPQFLQLGNKKMRFPYVVRVNEMLRALHMAKVITMVVSEGTESLPDGVHYSASSQETVGTNVAEQ
eukprot:gene17777-12468_t